MAELDEKILKKAVFEALGADGLSEASQTAVLEAASGPIIQSVTLAILQKLPSAMQEAFKSAMESGNDAAVEQILAEYIPNSTEFIGEEVRKAAAEFKQLFEKELRK